MGGLERTKNTREGCANDPETVVHAFHEKLQNIGKIQERGAQFSQYQWDFHIPCDSQNRLETQKKGVQRPQKHQYAVYMRNARIQEKRSRGVYKISDIRRIPPSKLEAQNIRKAHESGIQMTQKQRYTHSKRNSRIQEKSSRGAHNLANISGIYKFPVTPRAHGKHRKRVYRGPRNSSTPIT